MLATQGCWLKWPGYAPCSPISPSTQNSHSPSKNCQQQFISSKNDSMMQQVRWSSTSRQLRRGWKPLKLDLASKWHWLTLPVRENCKANSIGLKYRGCQKTQGDTTFNLTIPRPLASMAKWRAAATKPAAVPTFETNTAVQHRITGPHNENTISAGYVDKPDTGFGSAKNCTPHVKGHTVSCEGTTQDSTCKTAPF